ncbi:MAG: lysophospholipid acyltransferase family protein [Acutalibacteraceae bacterium]
MKSDFSEPFESRIYNPLKKAAKALLRIGFDITCVGEENIPENGGFVLAANHLSFFDPVMLVAFCPRTCHFMAKSDLFEKPFLGSLIKSMNAFPVKRGISDKRALSFAEKIINNGWVLGIFPEGTRSKDFRPQQAKNGVAYLARKTKADVLPVSIHRSKGEFFRPDVVIRFGEIIKNDKLGFENEYNPKQIRNAAKMIMDNICSLWKTDEKENENEN